MPKDADFRTDLTRGFQGEHRMQKLFRAEGFYVRSVGMTADAMTGLSQKDGVDLILEVAGLPEIAVEVKTDSMGGETGFAFIETEIVSDDGSTLPGWAGKVNEADDLVIHIPSSGKVCIIAMTELPKLLGGPWLELRRISGPNNPVAVGPHFHARGKLVSLTRERIVLANGTTQKSHRHPPEAAIEEVAHSFLVPPWGTWRRAEPNDYNAVPERFAMLHSPAQSTPERVEARTNIMGGGDFVGAQVSIFGQQSI